MSWDCNIRARCWLSEAYEGSSLKILLIGNYEADAQQSMRRYAELMQRGLSEAGLEAILAVPAAILNRSKRPATGIWKWVGYIDKYVLSPAEIARAAIDADVVHVCDHANAVYVPRRSRAPYLVTCHDLLAVRGAMGEATDCPTGFAGRQLQLTILKGLRRASALACVSGATLRDAERLLPGYEGRLVLVPNALNHPYHVLEPALLQRCLTRAGIVGPYLLHVGSNLRRKNREAVLRAAQHCSQYWRGKIVFAGQSLSSDLRSMARELDLLDRIVEIEKPSNAMLEALYNGALALLFPSRFEGFGWPIIEAQACGCPVICSDRAPFPEVSGNAAILVDAEDYAGMARSIVELAGAGSRREELRTRGLENASRYGRDFMVSQFVRLYEELILAARPSRSYA
jgi:glycosyltransferase involved in cell wall biosynthesis